MSVFGSIGFPMRSFFARATSSSTTSSYTFWWTISRDVAVHRCPAVPNAPNITPSIRTSRSASSIARIAFFPPSSRPTLIIFFAAASYTCLPVSTPPVKETARMSGWATIPSPTTAPFPVTMFTTPGGNPASSRHSTNFAPQIGVREEGLNTIGQPAMRAAPGAGGGRLAPLRGGARGGPHGGVHVLGGPGGERAQCVLGGGFDRVDPLPALRVHPLPADVEAVLLDHRIPARARKVAGR